MKIDFPFASGTKKKFAFMVGKLAIARDDDDGDGDDDDSARLMTTTRSRITIAY